MSLPLGGLALVLALLACDNDSASREGTDVSQDAGKNGGSSGGGAAGAGAAGGLSGGTAGGGAASGSGGVVSGGGAGGATGPSCPPPPPVGVCRPYDPTSCGAEEDCLVTKCLPSQIFSCTNGAWVGSQDCLGERCVSFDEPGYCGGKSKRTCAADQTCVKATAGATDALGVCQPMP